MNRSDFDLSAKSRSSKLSDYLNPHRPSRAADALHGSFNRGCVQIRHFLPGDIFDLLSCNLAYFVLIGRARSLSDTGRAFEQNQMGIASVLALGPDFNEKEALSWFQKAAQQGYAPAQE